MSPVLPTRQKEWIPRSPIILCRHKMEHQKIARIVLMTVISLLLPLTGPVEWFIESSEH